MEFTAVILLTFMIFSFAESNKDPNEEKVIAHVEKVAKNIPTTRFETDTIVTQKVDSINANSKYTLLGDHEVIYERDSNDKAKDVVVLSSEEDKIPFKVSKKFYVVLKLKSKAEPPAYSVSLAILRPASEKDEEVIELNGKKKAVEWSTFTENFAQKRSSLTFYTLQCASAFWVPCNFNESSLSAEEKEATAPKFQGKLVSVAAFQEIESIVPEVEDGADAMENGDLYYDLGFKQNETSGAGRMMQPYYSGPPPPGYILGGVPLSAYNPVYAPPRPGEGVLPNGQPLLADVQYFPSQPPDAGVGFLGAILTGVGGVACGIVSILASCADERAFHNTMPIGMAAVEGWNKNTWQLKTLMDGKRKRRETEVKFNLEAGLDYPGWITQYKVPKSGITESTESVGIFHGFGSCSPKPADPLSLKKVEGQESIIEFYLTALRGNCIPWLKEYIQQLIEKGFLVVKDKSLEFNPSLPLGKEPKLTLKESIQLSSAAELDAFSKVYIEESENPIKVYKSPDSRDIPKSIHLINKAGLKGLQRMFEYAPVHVIHLRRHFLQSFKQILSKLRQDHQNLDRCNDCTKDKELNMNAKLMVVGMIRFIEFGSGAVKIPSDTVSYFEKYYTKNFHLIQKLVDLYV